MEPTRRELLRFGGVSLLSGGLLDVLAARALAAPAKATAKACILLFQVGGPYQCDTLDPKPAAPDEARGPYKLLRTTAPGLDLTTAPVHLRRGPGEGTLLNAQSARTSSV